jgi:radical SAM superfamily enzyme YgiQ (UPF0313 family)
MRIKLISPRMSLRPMDSEFKRVLSPSLSLLTVAALTPDSHSVYVEDENVSPLDLSDHPDLVGITVNVDTSLRAYDIAQSYRQRGIPVVLGGIHPSANPGQAEQFADAICVGEAEEVWERVLSDTANGKLQKRYYHEHPADMARTPRPKWELLDTSNYLYTNVVCASRSCPFACEFCYNSCDYIHHQYRNRPLAHVLDEIRSLKTKQVMFIDDNFIGNPEWTRAFIEAIMPMKLTWHAAVSTNIGQQPDLLDAMQASGCRSLFIGFESINGDSIHSVGKRQNKVELYDQTIAEIHRRGIMVNASMAFGFDHEDASIFPQTLDWLVRNRVETMTGHILTPYPGTTLYNRLLAENRIIDFDPTHYNTAHVVFQPKRMSPQELYDGYLWMYENVYAVDNVLKRLPATGRVRIPYLLFNLGYRKYGKSVSRLARHGMMSSIGRLARRLSYGIQ